MLTASVYRTMDPSLECAFPGSWTWADDLQALQFADLKGQYLVAMASPGELILGNDQHNLTLAGIADQSASLQLSVLLFMQVFSRPPFISVHLSVLCRSASGQVTANAWHRQLFVETTQFPAASLPAWLDLALGDSFFTQLQGLRAPQISSTICNPTANFILVPQAAGQPLNLRTYATHCAWNNMTVSNGVVARNLVQTTEQLGIGTLISNGEVLSQNCTRTPRTPTSPSRARRPRPARPGSPRCGLCRRPPPLSSRSRSR